MDKGKKGEGAGGGKLRLDSMVQVTLCMYVKDYCLSRNEQDTIHNSTCDEAVWLVTLFR